MLPVCVELYNHVSNQGALNHRQLAASSLGFVTKPIYLVQLGCCRTHLLYVCSEAILCWEQQPAARDHVTLLTRYWWLDDVTGGFGYHGTY
jgi:hypothetical protein